MGLRDVVKRPSELEDLRHDMRKSIALCILLFSTSTLAESIPLWKFFEPFDLARLSISPAGTYLAASILHGDGAEQDCKLQVVNRETGEIEFTFGMPEKRRISSIRWIDDETILIRPSEKIPNEDFYFATYEYMKVSVKDWKTTDLPVGAIFNFLYEEPDHALITRVDGRYRELFKIHMQSGAKTKIARAPTRGGSFVLTKDRKDVAFHVGTDEDGFIVVHERLGNAEWKRLARYRFDQKGWRPLYAAFKPDEFFTRDWRNTTKGIEALGIYNRVTGEHREIFRDETYDIGSLLNDRFGNVWGLRIDHHYPRVVYLNPNHALANAHKTIQQQFPQRTITILNYTQDYRTVVARVSAAHALSEYVILDANTGSFDQITDRENEIGLAPSTLAAMQPFGLKARDGTSVYGYLSSVKTTPRPGPMVVLVHGGPWLRDSWGWDGEVQVLATNGFHVMQVNFRGSSGFGLDFETMGYKQWGGTMQDDVTDATRWAINEGIADENRICIMGASYGAYAALMGVAKEPDLYQCAIGYAGIYDVTAIERIGDVARWKTGINQWKITIGANLEEREPMSVLNYADQIKAAVMLIHGGQDRRTPPEHFHRMKQAFEEIGKPVETLFRANQGHGFFGRDTVMYMYGEQLKFLNKHIGNNEVQDEIGVVTTGR